MMKYERLTTKGKDGNWQVFEEETEHPFESLQNAIDRLAEYEDDEESGKIVRLPCKVGDTVYKIMHVCGNRRIVEFEVSRISIYEKEICVYFHKSKESWREWCTKPHHFGRNVFLTREEAENA